MWDNNFFNDSDIKRIIFYTSKKENLLELDNNNILNLPFYDYTYNNIEISKKLSALYENIVTSFYRPYAKRFDTKNLEE